MIIACRQCIPADMGLRALPNLLRVCADKVMGEVAAATVERPEGLRKAGTALLPSPKYERQEKMWPVINSRLLWRSPCVMLLSERVVHTRLGHLSCTECPTKAAELSREPGWPAKRQRSRHADEASTAGAGPAVHFAPRLESAIKADGYVSAWLVL